MWAETWGLSQWGFGEAIKLREVPRKKYEIYHSH